VTFFIDNNLSARLARGMKEFGEDVCHLVDHYDSSIPEFSDEEWLRFVGEKVGL
jgi:hypothetical protein